MLRVDIGFSRYLALSLLLGYGISFAVVLYLTAVSHLAWALLAAVLGFDAVQQFQRHVALTHAKSIHQVRYQSANQWQLFTASQVYSVQLLAESYCSPWLMVLRFAAEPSGQWVVILLPDAAEPAQLRQLRVILSQTDLFTSTPESNLS